MTTSLLELHFVLFVYTGYPPPPPKKKENYELSRLRECEPLIGNFDIWSYIFSN
jgi:hypothetical protein